MPSLTSAPPRTAGFLLNGKWIAQGPTVEIRSPYDQSVVGAVVMANAQQLEEAISAAVHAFEVTRKLAAFERAHILRDISHGIASRHEDFARSIAAEAGKPIKTARAEVDRAVFTFSIAAEEATRIGGEYLPLDLQSFTAGRWGPSQLSRPLIFR